MLLGTGLSGTIGRKLSNKIQPAQLRLGTDKLSDYFVPLEKEVQLIHLAGIVGEKRVTSDLTYSENINVKETLNLAREVIEDFNGRFIHISTSHIYGPQTGKISEDSDFNPRTHYAEQKLMAELKLIEYFGVDHPQLLVLRVFSVLGWDVESFTLGGTVNRIINGSQELISDTSDVRDFMTPTRIAKSIEYLSSKSTIYGAYNLCTGNGLSVSQAIESMFDAFGKVINREQLLTGNSTAARIVGDNKKILDAIPELDLTWNPKEDLLTSTKRTNS